jgi:tetratricopeptide (TPR) repeat protein
MERQQTFRIWIIGWLLFSSFMTACSFGGSARRHFNQGVANYNSGDYEQAIADYSKAIELDPDDATAYSNRGSAYKESGDLEQAIADYNKAIELDPDDGTVYNNRGNAYVDIGELEDAIADFEWYLEVAPNVLERTEIMEIIGQLKSALSP